MASERGTATGREAILARATHLFARRGFEGTSVQDVADAVGVTKQAVLHHYASKEELRRAVIEGTLAHWHQALPGLLLAATASDDRFEAVFGELWRFFSEDADRARLFVRETLDRPDELRRLLRGPVRPWLDAVAGYIRAGREGGRHHADVDPEAYVVSTLMMVISTVAARSVMAAALDGDEVGRIEREARRAARSALFQAGERPREALVSDGSSEGPRQARAAQGKGSGERPRRARAAKG